MAKAAGRRRPRVARQRLDVHFLIAWQTLRDRAVGDVMASVDARDAQAGQSTQMIEALPRLPACRSFPSRVRSGYAHGCARVEAVRKRVRLTGTREGTAPAGMASWLPLFFKWSARLSDDLHGRPLFVPLPGTQAAVLARWGDDAGTRVRSAAFALTWLRLMAHSPVIVEMVR